MRTSSRLSRFIAARSGLASGHMRACSSERWPRATVSYVRMSLLSSKQQKTFCTSFTAVSSTTAATSSTGRRRAQSACIFQEISTRDEATAKR